MLPVLLLLLLISVDFGRVFLGWVQLNNAARIAANYAASGQPPLTAAQQAQYRDIVSKETASINCDLPNPIPDPTYPSGTAVGGQAVVSLSCTFHPITPLIAGFFGGSAGLGVGASANFPIRAGVLSNLGGTGTVYVAPNQDFSVSPVSGDAPLTINFTLLTQSGGNAQIYSWDFGDGFSSNLQNPGQHTYNSIGTFTITLQESNPGGSSPIYSHSVTVTNPVAAPVASFYGLVPAPCVDAGAPLAESCGGVSGSTIYYRYSPNPTISFFDTSQNASGATYAWDFGDPSSSSNTSTQQSPTHTYTKPGAYTVALTVTTSGGSSSASRTAYINLGCIVPSMLNASSGGANSIWTGANFLSSKLKYWKNGSYVGSAPNPSYTIGQQNPQATAFFTASASGPGAFACTTNGAVAPANVVPAP